MKKILIELLVVSGLIVVLAAVIYLVIDPPKRLVEARNVERWLAVNSILNGYLNYKFEHQGTEPVALIADVYYLIGEGMDFSGCIAQPTTAVVNLKPVLVGVYLSVIPFDSSGAEAGQAKTYYYLQKNFAGRLTVGACLAEAVDGITPEIKVGR